MHYNALPPAETLLLMTAPPQIHTARSMLSPRTTFLLLLQMHRQPEACNLDDIFVRDADEDIFVWKKKRWHRRTSSGHWDADRLNSKEERIYKTAMGFS